MPIAAKLGAKPLGIRLKVAQVDWMKGEFLAQRKPAQLAA